MTFLTKLTLTDDRNFLAIRNTKIELACSWSLHTLPIQSRTQVLFGSPRGEDSIFSCFQLTIFIDGVTAASWRPPLRSVIARLA